MNRVNIAIVVVIFLISTILIERAPSVIAGYNLATLFRGLWYWTLLFVAAAAAVINSEREGKKR